MSKLIYWLKNYGKKTGATRIQILFRMVAGGYLVYLAYNMTKELIQGTATPAGWAKVGYIAAIVVFAVFGGVYLFINLRAYLKQDFFVPGRDDVDQDGEGSQDGTGERSSGTGNISLNPDYGEIARAAHWVNPDADTDDETEQPDTNADAEQSDNK